MNKKKLLEFYNKYQLFIFPLVVGICAIVLIGGVIYPQLTKLLSNSQAQTELETRSHLLEAKAQQLSALDQSDIERKLNVALAVLPPDRDFGNVVGIVQNVVAASGYSLLSLQVGSSGGKASAVSNYTIKIEVAGPKVAFDNLLSGIEGSYRLMKINSFDISTPRQGDSINGTITLEAYFSPIPTSLGGIDAPLPEISQQEQVFITKLVSSKGVVIQQVENQLALPKGRSNPFE